MATRRASVVYDREGAPAELVDLVSREGATFALVRLAGGTRVRVPAELLHLEPEGGYTIPARWSELPRVTASGVVLPILEERVASVGVREVPGERVRVRRRVITEEREVTTRVWTQRVEIERVRRDVFVDRAPEPRHEGDTLVIPVVDEVAVVEKRLRLREELRLRVHREPRDERTRVALRRHEVEIERDPGTESETAGNDKQQGGTR